VLHFGPPSFFVTRNADRILYECGAVRKPNFAAPTEDTMQPFCSPVPLLRQEEPDENQVEWAIALPVDRSDDVGGSFGHRQRRLGLRKRRVAANFLQTMLDGRRGLES
jgi:hypothetical protein